MPSIVSGYSYDIFISYRHKDNKVDGWVTSFVSNLKKELEAAFKEDISIYFDQNPNDGILETHHVDETVSAKIKCLVFIPILSQTYCDPKSFAWAQEFKPFIAFARADQSGLNVKLLNGNTACRVLPVRLHELDQPDKQLVETELGGILRAIDFIYRSAGVVRTLQQNEENPKANLNQTFYRDQMSKVVRGIKELISGMQSPVVASQTQAKVSQEEIPVTARRKLSIVAAIVMTLGILGYALFYFSGFGNRFFQEPDKSIAVLPFENINKDSTQDYFSNGIAEDILNHLVKIADLKVKSRTSTLQYKGTTKTVSEIGDELNVGNIVEGSVRRVGDKVRIVVQLIDTETDTHLWSETYDRDFKDVLALQSEIAIEIAKALQARLTNSERKDIEKVPTENITAYDYFLKATEFRRRGSLKRNDLEHAIQLTNQAIQNDKGFSRAYAYKASLWFDMSSYGLPENVWYDSVIQNADKAIRIDPLSPDGYLIKSRVFRFLGKLQQADAEVRSAYKVAPNNPEVLELYGYLLLRERKEEGADLVLKSTENQFSTKDPEYYSNLSNAYFFTHNSEMLVQLLTQSKNLNPDAVDPYTALAGVYNRQGQYDKAIQELQMALKINPDLALAVDQLGWSYYKNKDYENAAKYWSQYPQIESKFSDSLQTVPFRHRLAMTYAKMGRKKEGDKLVQEDLNIQKGLLEKKRGMGTWGNFGAIFYDLAVDNAYLGNDAQAVQCLDSAFHYQFYYFDGYDNDPIFEELKGREDFKKVVKKKSDWYEFLQAAFSSALNRTKASKDLKGLLEK